MHAHSENRSDCMFSDCWGQEVPTLFEKSACVHRRQLADVHVQLQAVGVRKSRPARQPVCMSSDRGGQEIPRQPVSEEPAGKAFGSNAAKEE